MSDRLAHFCVNTFLTLNSCAWPWVFGGVALRYGDLDRLWFWVSAGVVFGGVIFLVAAVLARSLRPTHATGSVTGIWRHVPSPWKFVGAAAIMLLLGGAGLVAERLSSRPPIRWPGRAANSPGCQLAAGCASGRLEELPQGFAAACVAKNYRQTETCRAASFSGPAPAGVVDSTNVAPRQCDDPRCEQLSGFLQHPLHRPSPEIRKAGHVQFLLDVHAVRLHGLGADVHLRGDLLGGQTLTE